MILAVRVKPRSKKPRGTNASRFPTGRYRKNRLIQVQQQKKAKIEYEHRPDL